MSNNTILVVDDEIGIRELLSEILRDEGYRVALAENAGQARNWRKQTRPDLVLAGYLDARYRWHYPPERMGELRIAHHASGNDVGTWHHRHRCRGNAHGRLWLS